MTAALDISPSNKISVLTGSGEVTLTLNPATGAVSGKFLHKDVEKKVPFKGVIFQKQQLGSGYFLGPTESGHVTITPLKAQGAP